MEYRELVRLYKDVHGTSKRLEKTYLISEFLKKVEDSEAEEITLLINGRIFPPWDDRKIGVASKIMVKAISKSTGLSEKEVEKEWKELGDLGSVASKAIAKRKQASLFPRQLTVKKVFDSVRNLATIEGKGSIDTKIDLISDLLISSTPDEALYLTRTILENLRAGIGAGTMRDAILWSVFGDELSLRYDDKEKGLVLDEGKRAEYNRHAERIQQAYDMINDYAKILVMLRHGGLSGLEKITLEAGKPVNVMLFQKAKDVADAFQTVGRPAAFEYKYDGFRLQIHKTKDAVKFYTRRLEDVTEQFPELVPVIEKSIIGNSYIIDGEAVGYDPSTKKYLPFQNISQRIKRKYDIKTLSEKYPVELNVFDILSHNGESFLNAPFIERRKLLGRIVRQQEKCIVLSKQIVTDSDEEAKAFYDESIRVGEEGVMAKNLQGIYKPGARVGFGVKIKPVLEPLDLVIVKAEWGEGKRGGWLTSYTLAIHDENREELLEIGKVSTGLKELSGENGENGVSFAQMTELLKPLITRSSGRDVEVRPEIVIEVGYEEIQKSVNYSSGYALRFPRFLRLRDDKPVDEIAAIGDVEHYFKIQKGRSTPSST